MESSRRRVLRSAGRGTLPASPPAGRGSAQHLGAQDDIEALVAKWQVVGPGHDSTSIRVMGRMRNVDARAICEVALVQRRVWLRPGTEIQETAVRPPSPRLLEKRDHGVQNDLVADEARVVRLQVEAPSPAHGDARNLSSVRPRRWARESGGAPLCHAVSLVVGCRRDSNGDVWRLTFNRSARHEPVTAWLRVRSR